MPEHNVNETQAIENPLMKLDSLPCYYTPRHKRESVYANTERLRRYKCSGEQSALPLASVWERKPFRVVFVKRKCSDISACMGKSAFFIVSCSSKHVPVKWNTGNLFISWPWWYFLGFFLKSVVFVHVRNSGLNQRWSSGSLSSWHRHSILVYLPHVNRWIIIIDSVWWMAELSGLRWKGEKVKRKVEVLREITFIWSFIHWYYCSYVSAEKNKREAEKLSRKSVDRLPAPQWEKQTFSLYGKLHVKYYHGSLLKQWCRNQKSLMEKEPWTGFCYW